MDWQPFVSTTPAKIAYSVNTIFRSFLGWISNSLKRNISYVKVLFHLRGRSIKSQAAKLAEELGFSSTTFCPVSKWKEQGY